MKLHFHPETEAEIEELNLEKQQVIKKQVKEFEDQGTKYKHFSRLTIKNHDSSLFRLKIKEDRPVEINQRILIDLFESQYVAYGIEHRNRVYSEEYLEEIKDRMY